MPNWDKMATRANRRVFSFYGKPVTVISNDSTIETHAVIEEDIAQYGEYGEVIGTVCMISVQVKEVGKLKKGTRIESAEGNWTIDKPEDSDGYLARYILKKA